MDSKAETILNALSMHLHHIETGLGSGGIRDIIPTYREIMEGRDNLGIEITFNLDCTPLKVYTNVWYMGGDYEYRCTILNTEDRQEVQFTNTCKPILSSYSPSFLGVFTKLGIQLDAVERFIHYLHGATVSIGEKLLGRWGHLKDLGSEWGLLPNDDAKCKTWVKKVQPTLYTIELRYVSDSMYELNGNARIEYEGNTISLAYHRGEVCLYNVDIKKPSPTIRLAMELELDATHNLKGLVGHINGQ